MTEQKVSMQDEAQFQRDLEQACSEACMAVETNGPSVGVCPPTYI